MTYFRLTFGLLLVDLLPGHPPLPVSHGYPRLPAFTASGLTFQQGFWGNTPLPARTVSGESPHIRYPQLPASTASGEHPSTNIHTPSDFKWTRPTSTTPSDFKWTRPASTINSNGLTHPTIVTLVLSARCCYLIARCRRRQIHHFYFYNLIFMT